jgi:hypothetical protein
LDVVVEKKSGLSCQCSDRYEKETPVYEQGQAFKLHNLQNGGIPINSEWKSKYNQVTNVIRAFLKAGFP